MHDNIFLLYAFEHRHIDMSLYSHVKIINEIEDVKSAIFFVMDSNYRCRKT